MNSVMCHKFVVVLCSVFLLSFGVSNSSPRCMPGSMFAAITLVAVRCLQWYTALFAKSFFLNVHPHKRMFFLA